MPVPTTASDQGANVITNTVKDQNPGAPPISKGEMIGLGAAAVGALGLLWYASRSGASPHPARDPRYHHKKLFRRHR